MGLRDWRMLSWAASRIAEERRSSSVVVARRGQFSWIDNVPYSQGGIYGATTPMSLPTRVSRSEALQVPAVLRGRNLICSPATLPLRCVDAERRPVRLPLLEQIDPHVPNVVTLAQTFEDLLFESTSWWQVLAFGWDGYPVQARHLDWAAVSMSPPPGYPLQSLPSGAFPNGVVWIAGTPVDAANMIRFDSPNPPLLVHGARAIRRAIKLEMAGERYADNPRPMDYFSPMDGADPADDDDVEALLDDWQVARQSRSTAYVPAALKYNAVDVMSPAELQLAEQQQKATLALANAMGIDPEDLGVSTTTRTYRNAVDRRQDRINETYSPYLQAVADRLSMGDVTPRGKRIVWDLDAFLRADPKTRWEAYGIAAGLEAITVDEIRAKEDQPALTPAQRASIQPKTPVVLPDVPAPEKPVPSNKPLSVVKQAVEPASMVQFEAAPTSLNFAAPPDATFAVDMTARTITGTAVVYGPTARSGWSMWRFQRGCLNWADPMRVKMLLNHDPSCAIGYASAIEDTDTGLRVTFKIARGDEGDAALVLAEDHVLDGLSVGIDFVDPDAWQPDPTDESVRLVTNARLREVTLCPIPSFDGARVDGVKASRQVITEVPGSTPPITSPISQEFTMPCTSCGQVHAVGTPCPAPVPVPAPQFTAPPAVQPAAPPAPDAAQFTAADIATVVSSAVDAAFTRAVEAMGQMPREQRHVVPVGPASVAEPLTYSLDGRGHSFVRDAWLARTREGTPSEQADAEARLRKYEQQTAELHLTAAARAAQFANGGNTTDQAQIIPPGYRPDLYVGQIPQGRPLFEAMSRGVIANSTPFKVPVWVGSSGLSGPNSEGVGPSSGTITNHTYVTVSPGAQSGKFPISRELVDSSNPAIDQIALAAMREEYAQDTESVVATAIAGATDDNTGSGQSTEGCYVYSVTGDGRDLAADGIDAAWAKFPFTRFTVAPDRLLLGQTGFGAMVKARDDIGRKMFPFMGAQNAQGTSGRASQSLDVSGLPADPAWALTAGTDDVVTFNHVDAWAWESPLLMFRFDEVQGPQNIVLALWGYFAFQILRYPGIHAIAFTAAG